MKRALSSAQTLMHPRGMWVLALGMVLAGCSPSSDTQDVDHAVPAETVVDETEEADENPASGTEEGLADESGDADGTDETDGADETSDTGGTDETNDTEQTDDMGDTGDPGASDEPGDSDDVEDPWADMGQFIEEQRALTNIPGLAVAVTRPGEVVWSGGFGFANMETNLPVTVDTPFMLASVSKTVTAAAVMHAYQQGVIGLDDPVDMHLPFSVDNPLVEDEVILVRHLVSHTSGIRDNWSQMPYADGDSPYALGDYLEGYLVVGGDWYYPEDNFFTSLPGLQFEYGNIGTALAGYVVESAVERPFDDYCDAVIFDVLSMTQTGWHLSDFDPSLVAMPYRYENGQHVAVGHYGYPDYPDGQLRSSVNDLARFLAAVSNQGELDGAQLLTPQVVSEMLSAQEPSVDSGQFVFWYESTLAGRRVVGHGGSDNGVATRIAFSQDTGVGVIMMFNTGWGTAGDAPDAIATALFDRAEGN